MNNGWENLIEKRNSKKDVCLILADWREDEGRYGDSYHLFAGHKFCREKRWRFLCESVQQRNTDHTGGQVNRTTASDKTQLLLIDSIECTGKVKKMVKLLVLRLISSSLLFIRRYTASPSLARPVHS